MHFSPQKCQLTKQYSISKTGQINEYKNVTKYGSNLETYRPKFLNIFYQIEAELRPKLLR